MKYRYNFSNMYFGNARPAFSNYSAPKSIVIGEIPFLENRPVKALILLHENNLSLTVARMNIIPATEFVTVTLKDMNGFPVINNLAGRFFNPFKNGNLNPENYGPNVYQFNEPFVVDWSNSYFRYVNNVALDTVVPFLIDYI